MANYMFPSIRFAPSLPIQHNLSDYYWQPHPQVPVIKYYQLINNNFKQRAPATNTEVHEFVQNHLKSLNISRSIVKEEEEFYHFHYNVVIHFQLLDKNCNRRHQVLVRINVASKISNALDLINLFEDIIIYNFYSFNHQSMMTRILNLEVLVKQ